MVETLFGSNRDIWWPAKDVTVEEGRLVPLNERPCLWFSRTFIWHPKPGWSVDSDHIDYTTKEPTLEAETIFDPDYEPGDYGYMGGILVKCSNFTPAPVWRLTGKHRRLVLDDDDIFEAKWPD